MTTTQKPEPSLGEQLRARRALDREVASQRRKKAVEAGLRKEHEAATAFLDHAKRFITDAIQGGKEPPRIHLDEHFIPDPGSDRGEDIAHLFGYYIGIMVDGKTPSPVQITDERHPLHEIWAEFVTWAESQDLKVEIVQAGEFFDHEIVVDLLDA